VVEEFGIPILVLMENAGRAVAEVVGRANRVLVLAGPGNNGGDGLVAARWLHNWGVRVAVLLLAERSQYKGAAGVQLGIVEKMRLPMVTEWSGAEADVIVDAIFGTGLSRAVEGRAAEVIQTANNANRRIVAVDIPSGMDADTGEELGVAIRATETISFCGTKRGFLQAGAEAFTGHVTVADIGAPRELMTELADR